VDYVNLNGKLLAKEDAGLPIHNGAVRYGYGVFETMLVRDTEIRLKQYHWERLVDGISKLFLELPAHITCSYLEEQVIQTVRKNKLEQLCRVRLQIHSGDGGLFEPGIVKAGFFIECFPLEESIIRFNVNGLVVGIAGGVQKSADTLANLKTCSALIYAIAARQAKANKWNDALVCNTDGNIIESTIANIFWVKNDVVHTPPLSEGCIAGIARRYLTDNTIVIEQKLALSDLEAADEVFLTNAIRGIKWVKNINNTNLNNVITKNLYNLFFVR
jgi:branched-chain amino acid aminotransferase